MRSILGIHEIMEMHHQFGCSFTVCLRWAANLVVVVPTLGTLVPIGTVPRSLRCACPGAGSVHDVGCLRRRCVLTSISMDVTYTTPCIITKLSVSANNDWFS